MLARLTFAVVDADGSPVQGAEIWHVDESRAVPPLPVRAERLGRTDAVGQLVSSHCFAGASDVVYWSTSPNPTRLSFLILHDTLGVRRTVVEPSLTAVYSEADVRTTRVGRPVNRGYELHVPVTF